MSLKTQVKSSKSDKLGQASMDPAPDSSISMSCLERLLDVKLAELKNDMATKDCINDLKNIIVEQKSRIEELESRVIVMEKLIQNLKERSDDSEQYQRRLCLRIGGVELKQGTDGESGEECLKTVKKIFRELKVSIPDAVIDRAHRIGKIKEEGGKRYRQIIVRFTTWRHRTEVYRARKNSDKYCIRLDLTKERLKIMGKANDILKDMGRASESCYVFSDVNCRMCLKYDGKFQYFGNTNELLNFIKSMEATEDETNQSEASDGGEEE